MAELMRFANFLIYFGIGSFLANALFSEIFELPSSLQMPNSRIESLVVTEQNDIFISSTRWGRIQKFDENGRFVKGWHLEQGRRFIRLAQENQTLLANRNPGRPVYVYDFNGMLLRTIKKGDAEHQTKIEILQSSNVYPQGAKPYSVFGFGKVIVRKPGLLNRVAIEPKFWHYFIPHPFFSLALFMAGSLIRWVIITVGPPIK